ncbi:MAG: hypothetical protein OXT65_11775 [Alphaproteobacteria bacterium]|nr:hypothetical protein [Alphaproteobacteria bacterium]
MSDAEPRDFILRSFHIRVKDDRALKRIGYHTNTSRAEIVRLLLRFGVALVEALEERSGELLNDFTKLERILDGFIGKIPAVLDELDDKPSPEKDEP